MQPQSTFFFYDLETSGINARESRIMQFAGIRTDLNLKPIGEPENLFIKLTPDILPDPDAVLLTGITPQATMADGLTEAEFLKYFENDIATPGTIFLGFNTVRFDDEFMRCLHYRNFYDAYEWQWQDGKSRWDLLDVVRMTRALRPDGIEWPFSSDGKPTNRLELLTALNKLEHEHAHDALSDVYATIEVARLIRNKQQKLFDYLFTMRDKRKVAELVEAGQPFVYCSGQYPSEFEKAAVVTQVCTHPKRQGSMVFDLRHDPSAYKDMSADQLAEAWKWKKDSTEDRLPVKVLQYNKCPAVAPLGVLDEKTRERLNVDLEVVKKHAKILASMPDFADRLQKAADILDQAMQTSFMVDNRHVDGQLYDGFFGNQDKQNMRVVRAAKPDELADLNLSFQDNRLTALLPLYKARNYPRTLSSEEREQWDAFCHEQLLGGGKQSRMAKYLSRLQDMIKDGNLTDHQEYLLEELKLYAESIMPEDDM
ncbi:MAG: exodeoxyribonuclease I [Candidatus Saccharibacteria bacterium]